MVTCSGGTWLFVLIKWNPSLFIAPYFGSYSDSSSPSSVGIGIGLSLFVLIFIVVIVLAVVRAYARQATRVRLVAKFSADDTVFMMTTTQNGTCTPGFDLYAPQSCPTTDSSYPTTGHPAATPPYPSWQYSHTMTWLLIVTLHYAFNRTVTLFVMIMLYTCMCNNLM